MTVLLIRANRNDIDAQHLAALGISSRVDPYLRISSVKNIAGAMRMLSELDDAKKSTARPTWLAITSTNALSYFDDLLPEHELDRIFDKNSNVKFAAIGNQTSSQLIARGATEVLQPVNANSESLADLMCKGTAGTVVIPSGSIAMETLANRLADSGFKIVSEVVYETSFVSESPVSVDEVRDGMFDAVLLRSPSAARAFEQFNPNASVKVICAGEATAIQAQKLGLNVAAVSAGPDPQLVAQTIAKVIGSQK
ncbi:uroporphyrinogen-III synthase [Candidatus Rhodoluna planktonica]|uniref:Uroporphyrinogen-III synthase n=1 Tax=Candidatus Rhodoluna planktonica TaxID=535712 RepID=A0A1D9E0P3_9MICO|nr:uroporphyrinogen-III synthase [Candidatus Rhodoluna planktonica]AOY56590.1 hypothetical protein A4Z71_06520 [Candidatus Rhodoluna planktonica]